MFLMVKESLKSFKAKSNTLVVLVMALLMMKMVIIHVRLMSTKVVFEKEKRMDLDNSKSSILL
jgi:hypothetical protein